MRKTFEGLILKHIDLKERDKLLTVLTADRGKVTIYGNNIRSLKRGTLSYTLPFQYCRFEVEVRQNHLTLVNGEIIHSFLDIQKDLAAMALGQYILDITQEMTVENNNEGAILSLVLNTLYLIQKAKKPLGLIKATFELRIMALAGYMPDLYGCDYCGKTEGEMFFDIMNGRLICCDCQRIRNTAEAKTEELGTAVIVVRLTPSVLKGLRYVLSADHQRVFSYSIAEDTLEEYADVCEKYILNHLERGFNTLDFYKEVTSM